MRIDAHEYEQLDLRAHSLLEDVPLHDVWAVDLPGGGPGRSVLEVRDLVSVERLGAGGAAVRALFGLRRALGRLFGWDQQPARAAASSFAERLDETERAASLVAPGTRDGPFCVLHASAREVISEVRNATVHAFSVFALIERGAGYRFYWAVYVRPVGRITGWYMRLIDPFRRLLVYPALLRQLRRAWPRSGAAAS